MNGQFYLVYHIRKYVNPSNMGNYSIHGTWRVSLLYIYMAWLSVLYMFSSILTCFKYFDIVIRCQNALHHILDIMHVKEECLWNQFWNFFISKRKNKEWGKFSKQGFFVARRYGSKTNISSTCAPDPSNQR